MFIYVCMYVCMVGLTWRLGGISYVCVYVCMYVCIHVCMYVCFTRWLSTDVFHSWSLRYAFDPATTSDVVHGSEVLKFDCVRKWVSHFLFAEHRIRWWCAIVDARWYVVPWREFKNARLAKVVENIFKPCTDWPGHSPRIRRGVLNKMLHTTRPFTTSLGGNFVERYRTNMPPRSHKFKLLLVVVVQCK